MRRTSAALALVLLGTLLLASPASAASVTFSTPQMQYHRGDVIIISGIAMANTTVRVQVFGGVQGSELEFQNFTAANATGAFLYGLPVNASWSFGTKLLLLTDMGSGAFAFSQIEIVMSPQDAAAQEAAAAQSFSDAVWLMGGFLVILSLCVLLIMGAYAEFRTRRLTLTQTLGRFGGALEAATDRWWWQLTTFLQPDGNYLENQDSGNVSFYIRKAVRQKILAEKDIEHAEWLMEDATNRKERAQTDIDAFDFQYKEYVAARKRPAFQER